MVHSAERAIALLLRRHLAAAYRRLELMRPALTPSSADILDASIGFADLAGSTQPSPPNRLWEFTAARPYDLTLRVDRHWTTAGYIRAVCDGPQQTSLSVHEDGVSRHRRSRIPALHTPQDDPDGPDATAGAMTAIQGVCPHLALVETETRERSRSAHVRKNTDRRF